MGLWCFITTLGQGSGRFWFFERDLDRALTVCSGSGSDFSMLSAQLLLPSCEQLALEGKPEDAGPQPEQTALP